MTASQQNENRTGGLARRMARVTGGTAGTGAATAPGRAGAGADIAVARPGLPGGLAAAGPASGEPAAAHRLAPLVTMGIGGGRSSAAIFERI
jgi:hypothetical protein